MGDYSENSVCGICGEEKPCRRVQYADESLWICGECREQEQADAQAAAEANFECMCYRLTPKGEEALRHAETLDTMGAIGEAV